MRLRFSRASSKLSWNVNSLIFSRKLNYSLSGKVPLQATKMQSNWRVMLNPSRWNQEMFEHYISIHPEARRLAQSKGQCRMKSVPQRGDTISFVYNGKIVMRGTCESNGFEIGTEHQIHSCHKGNIRPHAQTNEFVWIMITEVGLSEDIRKTGQRTWAKMPATIPSPIRRHRV